MSNAQVSISMLRFSNVDAVTIAHSTNCVSFINVGETQVAVLHTVEGGLVHVKDLNQLKGINTGDAFVVDAMGDLKKLDSGDPVEE